MAYSRSKSDGSFEEFISDKKLKKIFGEKMKQDIEIGGIYKHFKGKDYKVLFLGKETEAQEDVVIYISLYAPYIVWVRSLEKFKEYIEDKKVFRFSPILTNPTES